MSIITISREFGSGGRELGKRLADHLGYTYYDKEIINQIANENNLDKRYVENILSGSFATSFHFTFNRSFFDPLALNVTQARFLLEQKRVIEELAKTQDNIVIVGRNADFILKDYSPLRIFVCADTEAKIKRCKERKDGNKEDMSDKEIQNYIKRIDKNRADTTTIVTGGVWGDRSSYDLILNTSNCSIKEYSLHLADLVRAYFKEIKHK